MGKFNDRKKFGGGRSFGGGGRSFGGGNRGGFGSGRSGFGGRDGGRPQMHKATCSECGKECELPFRPTGDRPVFCSTCFDKQGGGNERPSRFGGERRDRSERPRHEDRGGMHDAVCGKCGAKCQVPFRPTPGKEVLCDDCFGKSGKGGKDNGELMVELKGLHVKLDRLMKLLAPADKTVKSEVYPVKSGKAGLPKAEFNGVKKEIAAPKKNVEVKKEVKAVKKVVAKKVVAKKKK